MADVVDKATRSRMMAGIRGDDTEPERAVRSYLHAQGFRFRKNDARYPGKPDILLPKYNAAVFVHGCFWHRHPGCRFATSPANNSVFWETKLNGNVERDLRTKAKLVELGFRVFTIWECEATNVDKLEALIAALERDA